MLIDASFFVPSKMIRVPPIITPACAVLSVSADSATASPVVLIKRIVNLIPQRGRDGPLHIAAND